jgi:hypothetical protein
MPSAFSHDPAITVPGASTDNAIVIFDGTGGTGFGNSTILVDSGGNGRIGIAGDTDLIIVTANTVTIAGKLVATSLDVGDGAITIDVTQSSHSLTVGMPIKVSGANQYAAAQANSAANAEVVGIVTAVASSSAFTMTLAGEITTAGAVPDSTSPGDIVYLSTSAGAVTTTEPSTAGEVSKPIAVITEANNKMIMLPYRGEVISSATDSMDLNGTELVLDADADTSITADTDDQIDIKISGADDFRFTANNFNILSGSTITIDSGATIANSGTATGFSSGPSEADQENMEDEDTGTLYAPPDLIKHSPGVAKAWVRFEQAGTHTKSADYNVDSVTDGGLGDTDVLWDTDFAGTEYVVTASAGNVENVGVDTLATTGCRVVVNDLAAGGVDSIGVMIAAFGDQ